MTKKQIALNAVNALKKEYPEAICSLVYTDPLQLLIAARLAAQCTDARVNMVTPALFARFRTVDDFANSTADEVAEYIKSCGIDHEFRTTLVREFHTAEDLTAIGRWLPRNARYFLQAFVDSGNLIGQGYHGFAAQEMRDLAALVRPLLPRTELRGAD